MAADALKDLAVEAVQTGMGFESAMSSVGAISGAVGDELDQLTDKAKEMGATTKFTAAESAEAFQYMAMAGWKTEDMLGGIDGILKLAAASGESLATTSDIVTDAMTAFGLSADQAGHFADVLAAASSNANTNVGMMGETFKYAAPIAGSLGYSIEDTAEAIGLMANSGIKASQAGTSLRTIMSQLANNFDVQGEAIGKVTVNVQNADGSMRSFSDIIADTREAFNGLSESEKVNQARTLVGKNAMSGFLALINAAPADIDKLSSAIDNCDNSASDMADTMINNLSGDITIFQSAVDGMKIEIAEELNPVLRDVVKFATDKLPVVKDKAVALFKGVAEFGKKAVDFMPKAFAFAEKILPVLGGIGAAFLTIKAAAAIETGITAIVTFARVVKDAGGAVKVLNAIVAANPYIVVGAAVAALTAALIVLHQKQKEHSYDLSKYGEKYDELADSISTTGSNISKLHDSFNDNADSIIIETNRTKDLWTELDKLTDASGRVKDKDKERAQYILNELNEALGTEYSMTGNQIDNYKELENEIDKVIEKKQAESLLDSYLAMNSDMTKLYYESRQQYEELEPKMAEAQRLRDSGAETLSRITGMSVDEIENISADEWNTTYTPAAWGTTNGLTEEGVERYRAAREDYLKGKGTYVENSEAYNRILSNYRQSLEYMDKLNAAHTAFAEERYDEVAGILYETRDANKDMLADTESSLEERTAAFEASLDRLKTNMKLTTKGMNQQAVDDLAETFGVAVQNALLTGKDLNTVITQDFKDQLEEMMNAGFDITGFFEFLADSGYSAGEIFGDHYTEIVQSQIDAGYDTTALEKWGHDSGLSIAEIYGDDWTKAAQAKIDRGFNIDELLRWAYDSGLGTSDEYMRMWEQNAQAQLDNMGAHMNMEPFMEWWRQLGDEAGLNFHSAYTRWIYETNDLVVRSIQSPGDLEVAGYADSIQHYAAGGFIGMGNKAVVAEAGPELLEVMNGGIKVTPLSRTARNISAGSEQGTTIINKYITVNAKVSSDYDVSRLAERLALEEKFVDTGKGLK